jgi:WD40 repeat protein
MPARRTCLSLLACLALLHSPPARGAAPPAGKAARVDIHGDPLPPGALARLGTLRWRHAHRGHFSRLRFSPDGRVLALCGNPGLLLWEVATGRPPRWAPAGAARATAAAFSADGKALLTVRPAPASPRPRDPSRGRWLVQRWEVGTGKLLREVVIEEDGPLQGHPALSADGRYLLTPGSPSRGAALWDTASGRRLLRLDQHLFLAVYYCLAVDAKALAVVVPGGDLRVYDLRTGRRRWQVKPGGESLFQPALSPDGKALAVPARDEPATSADCLRLYLYDARSGKRVAAARGRGSPVAFSPVAFSPGGKYLAWAEPHAVRLFEAATLKELRRLEGSPARPQSLAFSEDGRLLASSDEHSVSVWDVATGKRRDAPAGHRGVVWALCFSPDGRALASGADDGDALVWGVATQRVLHRLPGHSPAAVSLAFAPDGKTLATGEGTPNGYHCSEAQVRLWGLGHGRLVRQWYGHLGAVRGLAFSPDGRRLASAGGDDRARLWDVATGRRLRQVRNVVWSQWVDFSPGGKSVLVGGQVDPFLWEVATGKKVLCFGGPRGQGVVLARWLADGRRVAGAGPGGLRLWDAATGEELRTLPRLAATRGAGPFALSPDGKTFAAGSDPVGVWDTDTGECFARLRGHMISATALAFSPDSGALASGGYDTTILLWDVGRLRLAHLLGKAVGADEAAARRLAADPARATAFLHRRLGRAARAEARAAGLIRELDSDDFATRERATRGLVRLGPDAIFPLRAALEGGPSPEVRSRIRRALRELEGAGGADPALDPGRVRAALSLLETLGTPGARRAIEELAAGPEGAVVTREAAAAVRRLKAKGGRR